MDIGDKILHSINLLGDLPVSQLEFHHFYCWDFMIIMNRFATFYDSVGNLLQYLFGWNLVKIHGGWVLFVLFVNDMSKIFILWINEWDMQYTFICFT